MFLGTLGSAHFFPVASVLTFVASFLAGQAVRWCGGNPQYVQKSSCLPEAGFCPAAGLWRFGFSLAWYLKA